ncbi:MAG TPA: histidine kinase [Burkholderiaceae bacterium]|jgi:anti-sigma regulatory factor (Ser/Thr protein kinase)|nr:histidine kinase [Burkholderiaceae bacterium]
MSTPLPQEAVPLHMTGDSTVHAAIRHVASRLAATVGVCIVIAAFLTAMRGASISVNLVYSLCIGVCCYSFIDGARFLSARWHWRHAPGSPEAKASWPGWVWMVSCVVLGTVCGYAVGTRLGDLITGMSSSMLFRYGWRPYAMTLAFSLLVAITCTYFFYARARIAAIHAKAEAAQRVVAQTQLKLLESQLEPHMLFNTLANLRVLIALDPPRAQAMLDRLIAFLRATLSASRGAGMHPLSAEFERTCDYLALMQVRMGERLTTQLELPDELAAQPVPPLLLQPLVENAIQHGLEPHRGGGRIHVVASREGNDLVLSVRDTGAGLDPRHRSQGTGFGTQQVRERLATVYGARASFTLEPAEGGGTRATLRLPLPQA